MSIRRIALVTIAMISLGGAVAVAAPQLFLAQNNNPAPGTVNPGGYNRGMGGSLEQKDGSRWLDQLNLTPDQVQKIQAVRNQYDSKLQAKSQELRQAHDRLRELMQQNASNDEIRQQHLQVSKLRQEQGDLKFERMLAIREILNPEQRQQLATWMESKPGQGRHGRSRNDAEMNRPDF